MSEAEGWDPHIHIVPTLTISSLNLTKIRKQLLLKGHYMFILIINKHNLSTFEEIRLAPAKYKKATENSAQKVKYDKTNLLIPRGFSLAGQSTAIPRSTTG